MTGVAMSRLQKLRRLPWAERLLLVRAVCLVGAARLALSVLPFRLLQRLWQQPRTPPVPPWKPQRFSPDRIAWAVHRVSRLVPHATCLTQALAIQTLLRQAQHPARIEIGVRKTADHGLEAHAWVESGGHVLLGDAGPERYRRVGFLA